MQSVHTNHIDDQAAPQVRFFKDGRLVARIYASHTPSRTPASEAAAGTGDARRNAAAIATFHTPPTGAYPRGGSASREAVEKRWGLFPDSASSKTQLFDTWSCQQTETYARNVENLIGTVKVPVGLAGPLRVQGLFAQGDFYIPLATTEAALVASYSRGAMVITEAGGCTALLLNEGVSRAPGYVPLLRLRFGQVLGGVDRLSLGELYFPISVAVLYAFARQRYALYAIPLLTLTFADSIAALIGTRYGKASYSATGGTKTWEGSVAFFSAAFLCAHVPLLLLTDTGRLECLLVAAMLGILSTMLEGFAWGGLDNLFVPVGTLLLLRSLLRMGALELSLKLLIAVLLFGLAFRYGRKTSLNVGALMGGLLLCFCIWLLADWRWIVIPGLAFASYRILSPSNDWERRREHNFYVVFLILAGGLVWAMLSLLGNPRLPWFLAYATQFAAQLSLIVLLRYQISGAAQHFLLPALRAASLIVAAYVLLRAIWWEASWPRTPAEALLALAASLLAVWAYSHRYQTDPARDAVDIQSWWRLSFYSSGASWLAFLLSIALWSF